MTKSGNGNPKENAGYKAAEYVRDGMIVGLGTGSTVAFTMDRLAERIKGGLRITGVPTSIQTAMKARERGIPLASLDDVSQIDLTIDGADQIDPSLMLIKGRGAAQVRERCVADASKRLIIVADSSKLCDQLSGPVPVEVIPFALGHVTRKLEQMGGVVVVRDGVKKDGPVLSDNGNIILDYHSGPIKDPQALESEINNIPGVVGCGIMAEFSDIMTVIVGENDDCRILGIKEE
ncbi:ribose-5-phosphate isomerase RpiA [Methanospirillum lacunae]|uniref:Ribose-5-phosphate isomerase A n=1 Tax=Methanospirillum lacunae TaxID=668570 RepID=A0A2V2NEU8_9EURY|nr:ribose-5-phosphate isomerase RpiA [Methanospirillum lacunae]PWR73843.1 ribose 5-phosphate isomerase A [Methanospirillum lacunae]